MNSPLPVRLVCPRCRTPKPDGELRVIHLLPQEGRDYHLCPQCRAQYPVVESRIFCVPPDLEGFRQEQLHGGANPWPPLKESKAEPGTTPFVERDLCAQYGIAHYPESISGDPFLEPPLRSNLHTLDTVHNLLHQHRSYLSTTPNSAAAHCALEVGCGPGRMLSTLSPLFSGGAVGLDVRLSMLRLAMRLTRGEQVVVPYRHEGLRMEPLALRTPGQWNPGPVHLVQGDISTPPFDAEIFSLVAAFSVLDTVPDPVLALGQMDALLVPGGLLLLATPYNWQPHITPHQDWWSRQGQSGANTLGVLLSGQHPALPHLRYTLLQELDGLTWTLPGISRVTYRYVLHLILARKDG